MTDDASPASQGTDAMTGRPTTLLPNRELIRISLYWLGLSSIFAGLSTIMAGRLEFTGLVNHDDAGRALFLVSISGGDHRDDRPADGRLHLRLHDDPLGSPQAVHLHRLAARPGLPHRHRLEQHARLDRRLHRAAAVQLELRAGSVPGLRAGPRARSPGRDRQRARRADAGARRRVGLRHRLARASPLDDYALGLVALGVLEFVTMLSVVIRVREGPTAKSRDGRSWRAIAAEAWGSDILKERSFLWLVASRLAILMGGSRPDLAGGLLPGTLDAARRARRPGLVEIPLVALVALGTVASVVPAARVSRSGRAQAGHLDAAA